MNDLPFVPPALILLAQELPRCATWSDMRKRTKGMLRDLRDQSEYFQDWNIQQTDKPQRHSGFEVHLDGPLDLLSGRGCQAPACRLAAADRIARSIGLVADRIWLTDLLTERFVNFGRPTNEKLDKAIIDVVTLTRLMPLIRAGIVKFRSPWFHVCSSCKGYFEEQIDSLALDLVKEWRSEFRVVKRDDGGYEVHTGDLTGSPVIFSSNPGSRRIPKVETVAKSIIMDEVRSAMWAAREASMRGGAVFSSSRIGLAGLLKSDGQLTSKKPIRLLEDTRSFTVPWVSELDAAQVLQLREDASKALPALREKLIKALTVTDGNGIKPGAVPELVSELREQAVEVRQELEIKRNSASRFWKGTYGILGLGLSAYGIASEQILPGIGGLLPVIQLLINHKSGHESEVAKLENKPGFVLVRAQDILAHADSQES